MTPAPALDLTTSLRGDFCFFLWYHEFYICLMLTMGPRVPNFVVAGLCWCNRKFKFLVPRLPSVPMIQFTPLFAYASVRVPGILIF